MSVHLADVLSIQKSLLNYFFLRILNTSKFFFFYFNFLFSKYKSRKNETCVCTLAIRISKYRLSFQKYKREWSFLLIRITCKKYSKLTHPHMIWLFEFTDIAMFEDSSKVSDKPMAESSLKNESALITNDASVTSTKINEVEPIKRPMLGKIPKSHSVSTGTSPPPQSISTQVREKTFLLFGLRNE